ncbi:hypothetical protein C8A05DRAFT_34873 [Staphylotrichum tortipilum]|uniref:Uncharacterized protein n=1 Tax=Staphylotrichum tortipilum TaxID=2831512 RepID=A0AAN6MJJ8_9PEZI|nr:hypothetical protein C8A05DRAFT_34873 [Staphylotrichum longicolle]
MAKKYFSPYSPRRRQSPRLVLVWVSTFVFILWMTWYISTRHREQARPYVDEFMHPGQKMHRAVMDEEGQ